MTPDDAVRPATPAADARPASYVVHITPGKKGSRDKAECVDLPADVLERFSMAGAAWRNMKHRLKRLAALRRELKLPGLAVVYRPGRGRRIETPLPIPVPFEPIELDETHPALTQLVQHVVEPDPENPTIKKTFAVNRWLTRLGIPAVMLFVWIPQMIQAAVRDGVRSFGFGMWIAMLLVMFGILLYVHWFRSAQWFIVPGGVVLRRAVFGRVGESLQRFTPADTLLTIMREQRGWQGRLTRGPADVTKRLTELECVALLAAWQSRVRTPTLDEMADLR